jgi:hypothetical protein
MLGGRERLAEFAARNGIQESVSRRPLSVRRALSLMLAGATTVSAVLCAPVGRDSGLDLLHRMQRALGGADKIAAIRDVDWTVTANTFDHEGKRIGNVTKRTRWIRSNYLRLDQIGPGDTYVLYFDGTKGWEILPDKRVSDLVGSELNFAKAYLAGFMLNAWLADRSGGFTITSPAANVIRLSSSAGTTDITLNGVTSLPAQTLEWMDVQGIRFPARELNSHKGDGSADIRTKKVVFNVGLDPRDLAAKPADLKPVLVGR